MTIPDGYSDEPAMSISANGTTAGTAILWSAYSTNGDSPNGGASPGILVALNASDVTQELWDSNQNQSRDYSGSWAKWSPPTIANGKVYLATFDNVRQCVWSVVALGGGALVGNGTSSSDAVNLTSEGATDWEPLGRRELEPEGRRDAAVERLHRWWVAGQRSVYSNDPRPVSWTDGTPAASSTDNTDGLSIQGAGQGFSFQRRRTLRRVRWWFTQGEPIARERSRRTCQTDRRRISPTLPLSRARNTIAITSYLPRGQRRANPDSDLGDDVRFRRCDFKRCRSQCRNRGGKRRNAPKRHGEYRVRDRAAGHRDRWRRESDERRDGDVRGPNQRSQWDIRGRIQQRQRSNRHQWDRGGSHLHRQH